MKMTGPTRRKQSTEIQEQSLNSSEINGLLLRGDFQNVLAPRPRWGGTTFQPRH
jgi:hypothetical protein